MTGQANPDVPPEEGAQEPVAGDSMQVSPSNISITKAGQVDRDNLDRAVVHAASVLQTLAENQRALRETVERAERTEILLQNVSGLNDTFRSIATTQAKLLESIQASDRQRAQAEERARRSRIWTFVFAAGFISFAIVAFYAVSENLKSRDGDQGTLLAAIKADVENRRAERQLELQTLAASMRDAMSDRRNFEEKIGDLSQKERELQSAFEEQKNVKTASDTELESTRKELAEVRAKLAEYQNRIVNEGEGINRVMSILNSKGLSVEALRQSLQKDSALNDALRNSQNSATAGDAASRPTSSPAGDVFTKTETAALNAIASGPPATPVAPGVVADINALLAFASGTEMRLVDTGGRIGAELKDCYFTRYNNYGKPNGFIVSKKVYFTEAPADPRLSMHLLDGYDLSGTIKIPFTQKTVEFRAVDPAEWRRRLPELFTGVVAEATLPSVVGGAEQRDANPATLALRDHFNRVFEAHTEYLRLRIEDVASVEGDSLVGVTLQTFVVDRGATTPRVDQTIRARSAKFTYAAAQQRLEIELADGTRGREKPVPFLGGKLTLLIPGVLPGELEGEPQLPVRQK